MLANVTLFSGLDTQDLEVIASHAVIKAAAKNTIVISDNDHAHTLYTILSGKVKVYLGDERGKEIILATLDSGEYFGELALLDDSLRSASIMTLEPCKFLVLSKKAFKECLVKHPDIIFQLLKNLTCQVRRLTESVKNLALLDVYGRILKTLTRLGTERDGKVIIPQQLTHQDIANRVGASREMVSRILKDLETGGYLGFEAKRIVIKKKPPAAW